MKLIQTKTDYTHEPFFDAWRNLGFGYWRGDLGLAQVIGTAPGPHHDS